MPIDKKDQLANGANVGEALLRSLGLWEIGWPISKVVITVESKQLVTVQVTREVTVATVEGFTNVLSEYKLVPKEQQP